MTELDPNARLYAEVDKKLDKLDSKLDQVESESRTSFDKINDVMGKIAVTLERFIGRTDHLQTEVEDVKTDQHDYKQETNSRFEKIEAELKEHDRILQRNLQKWIILGAAASVVFAFSLTVVKPLLENRVTNDAATKALQDNNELMQKILDVVTPE